MKTIGNFMKWFLYITVGIVIVCGISYKMAGIEMVSVDVFGMIFVSGFVTTLATVLILPGEEDGKGMSCIKFVLHYIVLCAIMFFLGGRFGWVSYDLTGIIGMAVRVGLVYILAFLAYYIIDIRQAGEINKMLQKKYGEEDV